MPQKQSMSDQVLTQLREDLLNCVYKPGEIITETEVAQRYGSSKTPAREALGALCMEDFLLKFPRKGYLVKSISLSDIQSLFQFRGILECSGVALAARLATEEEIHLLRSICEEIEQFENRCAEGMAQQHDAGNFAFHMQIARMTHNPYLVTATANILNQMRRALTMDLLVSDASGAFEEHPHIVAAIEAHDPAAAEEAMCRHLNITQNRIYLQNFHRSQDPVRPSTL
ncbi:MAG: GntR family transcriptional regulator [Oscillospiraceae bacterium]|nr:MAG: GntR family transcriptional regulator [Oscillospiraceae bacterium]